MLRRIATVAALATLLGSGARGAAAGPVALFDEGHGQRFLAGRPGELDLSGLAAEFREAGMEVRIGRGRLDPATLHGVGVLVISGAFAPISPEEAETIRTFVGNGGRLALMLHIGQPAQSLLERMGIQYSRGPVHETAGVIGGRALDFSATRFSPHAITHGLGSLSVFGCWALKNFSPHAAEIVRTGRSAWLDSDGNGRFSAGEPVGEHALVVAGTLGKGVYVVFGDDAIFQNRFLGNYNRDLARRLVRWLASAAAGKQPAAPRPGGIKL